MINLYTNNWKIKNIDTVLFDKDGTFLDDNIYWGKLSEYRILAIIKHFNLNEKFFEDLCIAIGHNPKTCKLIKNGPVGTLSRNEVIEFMVNELLKYEIHTDFETISDLFECVHKDFLNDMDKHIKFIPHSEKFIKELKSKGVKLAVVTSDTYSHTVETLKILNISDCFDCIIGKDNCKNDKKSGEPALIAMKNMSADKSKTIVIGDALMDAMMAKNAGLTDAILVATGQTDKNDLIKLSNHVINNLGEVRIQNDL